MDVGEQIRAIAVRNARIELIDRVRGCNDLWRLEGALRAIKGSGDPGIPIHPTELATTGIKGIAVIPDGEG